MRSPPTRKHPPPAHQRAADLRIGKRGLTPELLEEVRRRMKDHRTLKVRILRTALSGGIVPEQVASNLVHAVDAHLVEVRGHTFVMTRKSKTQRQRRI